MFLKRNTKILGEKCHMQPGKQVLEKIRAINNYGIVIALKINELAICQFNCDKV